MIQHRGEDGAEDKSYRGGKGWKDEEGVNQGGERG